MTDTTLDRLQRLMREVFLDEGLNIGPETTALDVDGWDSLSHSMLMLEIEQAFGVPIDPALAARFADVGELLRHLDAHAP